MSSHFAPSGLFSHGYGTSALPMPAAYLRLFVRRFGRSRGQAEKMLRGTGISLAQARAAGPEDSILIWQQFRQLQNMREFVPPDWVMDVGPALQGSAHGALATAIATAVNLEKALEILERFGHLRAPFICPGRSAAGAKHTVTVAMRTSLETELLRPLTELVLLSIKALIESAIGEAISETHYVLPFPPPEYAERYRKVLAGPLYFDEGPESVAKISFPADWLGLACPFADSTQHLRALSELEDVKRNLEGQRLIEARVEQILENFPGRPPSAEAVAKSLHLSRRTLVRRLADNKTTFRVLADGHRRRRAQRLLLDESLTVAEISQRLGYTDSSNFGRAFRRWFGSSPSGYRAGQ